MEEKGYTVKENITKKTDLLITKNNSGSKYQFASENNIRILLYCDNFNDLKI